MIDYLPPCKLLENFDSDDNDIDIDIIFPSVFDLDKIKQYLKKFKETGYIQESTEFLNFLHFIGADNVDDRLIDLVKIKGNSQKYIIDSKYFESNVPEGFGSWLTLNRESVLKQGLFFRKEDFPNDSIEPIDWVKYGNLHIYKHIGVVDSIRDKICSLAAEGGHLDVLIWARANGCSWNTWTCAYAARNGHLDILMWCRANGCPWSDSTCYNAAFNGHLEVLKWAHENGCPWDDITCACAAENGHLEVLKWAYNNGCPWDESTCALAASNEHLDVLKWLRANGCPWDEWTYALAARNRHFKTSKWAHENGCPVPFFDEEHVSY